MKKKLTLIGATLLLATLAMLYREPILRLYYRVEFESIILAEAEKRRLDPHLVAAVIFTESRFREDSESQVGARGLMQLMPDTAAEVADKLDIADYSAEKLADPGTNIRLGTYYLAELRQRFSTEEAALAAYNAGPTVVEVWRRNGGEIAFEETREYVKNVKYHRKVLEQLYPEW